MRASFCPLRASTKLTISIKPRWPRGPSPLRYRPMSGSALRVLMELRPALGGHAGIPQATRLLFRTLAMRDDVEVSGLLQSAGHVLAKGIPEDGSRSLASLSPDRQFNRLGRVVITIEQRTRDFYAHATLGTIAMALRHLAGGRMRLSRFDARHYQDYVWRRFFSRTLPPEDLEVVLGARFRVARLPCSVMYSCA